MEKKIMGYDINMSINNACTTVLPHDMAIEINNVLHTYVENHIMGNHDYNKARSFEYLQKIIYADMRDRDMDDFMAIFTQERDMMIAYAGGMENYDDDYIIVAYHRPYSCQFDIYAFPTYNECDTFKMFTFDEEGGE